MLLVMIAMVGGMAHALTLSVTSPTANQIFTTQEIPITFTSDLPLSKVVVQVADEPPVEFNSIGGATSFAENVVITSRDVLVVKITATDTGTTEAVESRIIDVQLPVPTPSIVAAYKITEDESGDGNLGYAAQSDHPNVVLTFDASLSVIIPEAEVSYSWNLGDGTTSNRSKVSHVYAAPGTYNISLTVSSSTLTSTKVGTITVGTSDCFSGESQNICPYIVQSKEAVVPMAGSHFTIKDYGGRSLKLRTGSQISVILKAIKQSAEEVLPGGSEWDLSSSVTFDDDYTLRIPITALTALSLEPAYQYSIEILGLNPDDSTHSVYGDLEYSGTIANVKLGVGKVTYRTGATSKHVVISGNVRSLVRYESDVAANQSVVLENLPLGPYFIEEEDVPPPFSFKGIKRSLRNFFGEAKSTGVDGEVASIVLYGTYRDVISDSPVNPATGVPVSGGAPTYTPGTSTGTNLTSYGLTDWSSPRITPKYNIAVESHPSVIEMGSSMMTFVYHPPGVARGETYRATGVIEVNNNEVVIGCQMNVPALAKPLYMDAASQFKYLYEKSCATSGGCGNPRDYAYGYMKQQPLALDQDLPGTWYDLYEDKKLDEYFDNTLNIPITVNASLKDEDGLQVASAAYRTTYGEVGKEFGKNGQSLLDSYGYTNIGYQIANGYPPRSPYMVVKFLKLKIPRASYNVAKKYYLKVDLTSTRARADKASGTVSCGLVSGRTPTLQGFGPTLEKPIHAPADILGLPNYIQRSAISRGRFPVSPFRNMTDSYLNDSKNPYRIDSSLMEVAYDFYLDRASNVTLTGFKFTMLGETGNQLAAPVTIGASNFLDLETDSEGTMTGKIFFNLLDISGVRTSSTGLETLTRLPEKINLRIEPLVTNNYTGNPVPVMYKQIDIRPMFNLALASEKCLSYSTPYSSFAHGRIFKIAEHFSSPANLGATAGEEANFHLSCNDASYPVGGNFAWADVPWPNSTVTPTVVHESHKFGNSIDIRSFGPLPSPSTDPHYDQLRGNTYFALPADHECIATPNTKDCKKLVRSFSLNNRQRDVLEVFTYLANKVCSGGSCTCWAGGCITPTRAEYCLFKDTPIATPNNCGPAPRDAAKRLLDWVKINRRALTKIANHESLGAGLVALFSEGTDSGIENSMRKDVFVMSLPNLTLAQRGQFSNSWQYSLLKDGRFPFNYGSGRPVRLGISYNGTSDFAPINGCSSNPTICNLDFVKHEKFHTDHIHLQYEPERKAK